ncbi:MAG: hypothetical protein GY737_32780 [Desulfobacteraceae bacterium]|nr:hypothetical protein [Desulfobacteraceae bacterium]
MKIYWFLIILLIFNVSCAVHTIKNKNHNNLEFSNIVSNFQLTDLHGYNCDMINVDVLKHILKTGEIVDLRELHDHYSTTGCSVKGSIVVNGSKEGFTFDYGGIIYFSSGMILGCGEECCTGDFYNCSWDKDDLKGI